MNVQFGASCCALKFGHQQQTHNAQPRPAERPQEIKLDLPHETGDSVIFSGCCG